MHSLSAYFDYLAGSKARPRSIIIITHHEIDFHTFVSGDAYQF